MPSIRWDVLWRLTYSLANRILLFNKIAKAEGYAVFDSNQANWGGMAYLPNSNLNDTQDTKGTKDTIKPNEAGK